MACLYLTRQCDCLKKGISYRATYRALRVLQPGWSTFMGIKGKFWGDLEPSL